MQLTTLVENNIVEAFAHCDWQRATPAEIRFLAMIKLPYHIATDVSFDKYCIG